MSEEGLSRRYETLLQMLRCALIEIRSSDDTNVSHCLADIFHNLPLMLSLEFDQEKCERAFESIYSKAKKHQMVKYIKSLEASALKSISEKSQNSV